ncbi:MAG: DUF177 domain-containing protein [Sneathiella sp.]
MKVGKGHPMQDAGAEFTRWINVERLGAKPVTINITASDKECKDIAKRLQIPTVHSLMMTGTLGRKENTGLIELKASVKASVDQSCVVSLAPVRQEIEEEFAICYTFKKDDILVEDLDYVVGLEEDDLPELIVDGQVDVVQAMSEQVALALDPYPRAEGEEELLMSEDAQGLDAEAEDTDKQVHRPFADLKDLMKKN